MNLRSWIFSKILFLLILLIVLSCGAIAFFAIKDHQSYEIEFAKERVLFQADMCKIYIMKNDIVGMESFLKNIIHSADIMIYAWLEYNGRPYIKIFPDDAPKDLIGLQREIRTLVSIKELKNTEGDRFFDVATKVGITGYILHIGLSHKQMYYQLFNLILIILGVGGLVLLIASFLANKIAIITAYEAEKANKKLNGLRPDMLQTEKSDELSERAKRQFLTNMTHEIRTPMNGIMGMSDLLLETDLDKEQREYAEVINVSAKNLMGTINDILDFSGTESKKWDLQIVDFDLKIIIENIVKNFLCKASEKGLEIGLLIYHDVLSQLRGDPVRLEQMLVAIIGNAVKFTEKGEIVVRVTLVNETRNNVKIKFSVADTGIGISKEEMSRLFRPFSQLDDSITRKYSGTGLGLAISKQLAEVMGGEIGVKSTPGKGSTFWFTAIFEKQSEKNFSSSNISNVAISIVNNELKKSATEKQRIYRILVAEKNMVNQRLAVHILKQSGYLADGASNGNEVLTALNFAKYNLLLINPDLPDIDGFNLLKRIKNSQTKFNNKNMPVIAMTADLMNQKKYIKAGMNDCLIQPLKAEELYKAVEKSLKYEKRFIHGKIHSYRRQ
ncbi:histidine kinase [Candidatus Magnetomoraceae bacterium gMMP-15]